MRKQIIAALLICASMALAQAGAAQEKKSVAATDVGLPTGAHVPAFALKDQSGGDQSIDTLRGANGTVLLFVRSADW